MSMSNKIRFPRSSILLMVLIVSASLYALGCERETPRSGNKNWLGVSVQKMDSELRNYLDVDERYGVLVNEVAEASPADDAGLEREDVILRFDGKRIRDPEDLQRVVAKTRPGKKVTLEVVRDGKQQTLSVKMAERPREYAASKSGKLRRAPFAFSFGEHRRAWLGVQMHELNADLAEYFEVGKRDGVLILSVEKDSPAERAGLRAGDVLTAINDEKVSTPEQVQDIIGAYESGDDITVELVRKGEAKEVKVELEESSFTRPFRFKLKRLPEIPEFENHIKEWQEHYKDNLENLEERIQMEIEQNLDRHLNDAIERQFDGQQFQDNLEDDLRRMENELQLEMENLQKEIRKNVETQIWMDDKI